MIKTQSNPFLSNVSSGDNPCFMTDPWHQQADLIKHINQLDQNVITVIAPFEGGKTTFLKYLLMPEEALQKVVLTMDNDSSWEEVILQLKEKLGLMFEIEETLEEIAQSIDDYSQ